LQLKQRTHLHRGQSQPEGDFAMGFIRRHIDLSSAALVIWSALGFGRCQAFINILTVFQCVSQGV
jgi:hypothetical protein